jgi:hypothetical protein
VLREPRHPLRRREDRSAWWKVLIRENAYRDVWLVIVTVVLGWAVFAAYDAAHSADSATRAIQRERVSATRRVCEDQNLRNKATIDTLNKLGERDNAEATTPQAKLRAQQTIAGTKALVNALAPVRNCPEVVKATVGTEVPAAQ